MKERHTMNIDYDIVFDFLNSVKIDTTVENIIYARKDCYIDSLDDFWNYTKYKVITIGTNGNIYVYEKKIEWETDTEYEIKCIA